MKKPATKKVKTEKAKPKVKKATDTLKINVSFSKAVKALVKPKKK